MKVSKISELRNIVNSGWTIANRKAVITQIGKDNFNELATLARKSDIPMDFFQYNIVKNELEHFNKLKNLKVGDKYEPHTNMWISNLREYAHNRYGCSNNSDCKNVQYTILANKDSKIIETLYGKYEDDWFTEGVYYDRAIFEVCKRNFDGKTLKLWLKHIN